MLIFIVSKNPLVDINFFTAKRQYALKTALLDKRTAHKAYCP